MRKAPRERAARRKRAGEPPPPLQRPAPSSAMRGMRPPPAGALALSLASRTGITARAATAIKMRCAQSVPAAGIRITLKATAPAIAPTVFAAYTAPTMRPESLWCGAAAASASGKLAPHRQAAGSTAQRQRARSIWNVSHGLKLSRGSTGQYGSHASMLNAAQAMAAARSAWHQPSRTSGSLPPREAIDPAPLPRPSPNRNTARTMENV